MAEEVKIAKLTAYLKALPANTPDTPYEIQITDYAEESLEKLTKILGKAEKYVDLSSTVLDGITYFASVFGGYGCFDYLIAAPKFVNCTAKDANNLFLNCQNLKKVDTSGFVNVTNAERMFSGCSSLTSIDTSVFNNVTEANFMFDGCKSLTSIDTSAFKNVISAKYMFAECSSLTSIDMSSFINVQKATQMFAKCTSLSNIDISELKKLEDIVGMFLKCKSLKNIKMSNYSYLQQMNGVIEDCDNLDEETKSAVAELEKSIVDNPVLSYIVANLKVNFIFNLSLGGKEIIHSNVFSYFLEKSFLDLSFFDLDSAQYKVFTTLREKNDFDLIVAYCKNEDFEDLEQCFYNAGDGLDLTMQAENLSKKEIQEKASKLKFIVVENKFKSIPYFEQLDKYNQNITKGVDLGWKIMMTNENTDRFVLAPQSSLDSKADEIKKADWKTLSYEKSIEHLKKCPLEEGKTADERRDNNTFSGYLSAYTDMLEHCLKIADMAIEKSKESSCCAFVNEAAKKWLKQIRMHDFFEKLWFANALKLLPKKGEKNVDLCRSSYSHQNGLWEWKLKAPESAGLKNNLYFGVQIQAGHFMISLEPEWEYKYSSNVDKDEKIFTWVSSILNTLKEKYPNDLEEKSKNDKLNKYEDFKYSYLKIKNDKLTFEKLNEMINFAIDKINESFSSDSVKAFNDEEFATEKKKK